MSSLSWSNTKITLLEYCQKKYFFSYYDWSLKAFSPDLYELSSILRHLKTMEMWMWEKTHRLLSLYLLALKDQIINHKEPVDINHLKQQVATEMELAFTESQLRDYSKFDPHLRFGLTEHFYGEDTENLLEPTINKVFDNLDALIQSKWHERISAYFANGTKVYIENPTVPNFEAMKVDLWQVPELSNISLLAAPDFGAVLGEESFLILDWKSGKEKLDQDDMTDQLKIYALKILLNKKRRQLGDTKIHVEEVYLPSMQSKGGFITQKDLDDVIQKIIEDTTYQKQFLVNQDPLANIPLPHTHFQRTTSPKKCASCTFRLVCDKLKERE